MQLSRGRQGVLWGARLHSSAARCLWGQGCRSFTLGQGCTGSPVSSLCLFYSRRGWGWEWWSFLGVGASEVQEEADHSQVPSAPSFHGLILGPPHPVHLFVCLGPGFFVKLLLRLSRSLVSCWELLVRLGLQVPKLTLSLKVSVCFTSKVLNVARASPPPCFSF